MATPSPQDRLLHIYRQQRQLEETIQTLLDAQSDGLLAGLSNEPVSPTASTITTITATSTSSFPKLLTTSVVDVAPPWSQPKRKISLHAARKGILSALHDLHVLSVATTSILTEQLGARTAALQTISSYAVQQEALSSSLSTISHSPASLHVERLREQVSSLDHEIVEIEERLAQLKARRRQVAAERERAENKIQAEQSSYKASLTILDGKVKRFLKKLPVQGPVKNLRLPPLKQKKETKVAAKEDKGKQRLVDSTISDPGFSSSAAISTPPSPSPSRAEHEPDTTAFYSLIPSRRTLEMAAETFNIESSILESHISRLKEEQIALSLGSKLWSETIKSISGFESHLRTEIKRLVNSHSSPPPAAESSSKPIKPIEDTSESITKALLKEMETVLTQIEQSKQKAENEGWKLLEVAIGAEAEAFREGREILVETLLGTEVPDDAIDQTISHGDKEDLERTITGPSFVAESPEGLSRLRPTPNNRQPKVSGHAEDVDAGHPLPGAVDDYDEDDGPDPEFLITHTEV